MADRHIEKSDRCAADTFTCLDRATTDKMRRQREKALNILTKQRDN